jgi:putative PIN family toxin of toxin-antitoxin system
MPKNKPSRLIIDTNLWISFIISKKLNHLETLLLSNKIILIFSIELIEELNKTVNKPKLKNFFSENAIDEMLEVFEPFIDLVKIKSKVKICRDSNDDFLLALAKDGKADYLLTGDNDLLEIGKFDRTLIIKYKDFINKTNQ